MHDSVSLPLLDELRLAAAKQSGLVLLVLFGSRARGEAGERADWDFGYLAERPLDSLAVMAALGAVVRSERLDVVDLAHASGLLRYRAARDGVLVYEARQGLFDGFRFAAARFWFDAEPVLRAGYEAVLERLPK